ncbi:hypothetical protein LCGC14_1409910 [marine sediment metagenome]|uniref:Uncharacterized protein n=1 Tax=marine sediment metagenome TaxID=412755 RepID=A0A0F9M9Z4_9ZZZZ
MTEYQTISLMQSSTSEDDWNDNCDKVKAANNGKYPTYWFMAIIVSGLMGKVQETW